MVKKIPDGPFRTNCVFWAIVVWRKKKWRGYMWFRRSRYSSWKLHFGWTSTGRYLWEYSPVRPVNGMGALLHGIRFRGRIKLEGK